MFMFLRTCVAATAVTIFAGAAMAQSDSRYDRDRYRYDDYGNRQQSDTRYDRPTGQRYDTRSDRYGTRSDQSTTTPRRSGYADLFETQRQSRDVYGYDEPVYAPRGANDDWRVTQPQQGAYRGQSVAGQVRQVENKTHGNVQHRHVTVRTDNGQTLDIDLGPTSQLGGLNLERGERVRIMGRYRQAEGGGDEFTADRIQVDDEQRLLIDHELKHQWSTGNVVDLTRTGFMMRTDEGQRILVDLGPAAQQVDLYQGQRIQALGTLADINGQSLLIATQLRSLHANQFTTQQQQQRQQRDDDREEDEEDEWRNLGESILQDIFR